MPNLQSRFVASCGQPVEYQGQLIHLADKLSIKSGERLRIVRESTKPRWWRMPWKPRWQQAISLRTDEGIEVRGTRYQAIVRLWEDTAPPTVEIRAFTTSGNLEVWNAWQVGGKTHEWLSGAGMIVEELPNGRRYRCNDAIPDDDFSDLVFRIERIP